MVRPRDLDDPNKVPKATDPCSFVTDRWVKEVFTTIDTPLRTHRITLSYSKFAVCLDDRLFGRGSVRARTADGKAVSVGNANWFNFATWGTYTLGPNIRNDGAPQRLDTLPNAIRRRVAPAIVQSRSSDGEIVGRALAWGQELIFLSASRALLHFEQMVDADFDKTFELPKPQRAEVLKALNWSGLRFIDEGHLELVDEAFDCYRLVYRRATELKNAGKEPDDIQSDPFIAKLLLLATCLLTAAEQDVVNRALAVVIDSVPARLARGVDSKLSQLAHWRSGVPQQVAAYGLFARLQHAEGFLNDVWARLMTRYLLVIVLPTEMLRLGRDVPLRNPTEPIFPFALMDLRSPPSVLKDYKPHAQAAAVLEKLMTLQKFVNALDRSQAGVGSAAHDWRRFDDRLNWAICLFRSRQQDRTLYWSPYSVEDTRRIVAGQMPRATGHAGQAAVMPPLDPQSEIGNAFTSLLTGDGGGGGDGDGGGDGGGGGGEPSGPRRSRSKGMTS